LVAQLQGRGAERGAGGVTTPQRPCRRSSGYRARPAPQAGRPARRRWL
jgi:hypothetical protein